MARSSTRPRADQLVEAGHRLVVAAAAGGPDDVEGERSADHRRGGEQLGGTVGQRGQAAAQQVADVGRAPPRRPASGVEVRDDEERQSLALAHHLLRHSVRVLVGHRAGDQLGDRLRGRAARAGWPTPAPSRSRSASARESGPGVADLAAALGDDQARAVVAAAVHEVGEHLLGGVVRPLGVVDHEDARGRAPGRRHRPGDAVEEAGLGSGTLGRRGVEVGGRELGHQPGRLRPRTPERAVRALAPTPDRRPPAGADRRAGRRARRRRCRSSAPSAPGRPMPGERPPPRGGVLPTPGSPSTTTTRPGSDRGEELVELGVAARRAGSGPSTALARRRGSAPPAARPRPRR